MSLYQPVTRPRTIDKFYAALEAGQVLDTFGDPCFSIDCAACGRAHLNAEPCARDVECPDCHSRRSRCMRPSGHEEATWHKARWAAHAAVCAAWDAEGRRVVREWLPRPAEGAGRAGTVTLW